MREVKFRIYADGVYYNRVLVGNTDIESNDWVCPLVWVDSEKDWLHCDRGVINAYTGFKDSNGKEIYEDDIICVRCYGENFNYKVIWEAGGWRAKGNYGRGWWLVDLIYQALDGAVKVIGNKHENEEVWESILGGEPFYGTEYDESSSFDWEEE